MGDLNPATGILTVTLTRYSPLHRAAAAGRLIRETPGAHPITSIDELRSDAFGTDEELDEFLAFVAESRRADLA